MPADATATAAPPADRGRARSIICSRWTPFLLAAAAAVVALVVYHHVYPGMSWNRDEPVYLWQVDLLRAGRLTSSDMGVPELLLPWLSASPDGEMFTQYPLGWPLVMLAGSALGSTALAMVLASVLAVSGTYALADELTDDRSVAAAAGLFMLASPILAVHSGVYLTYLFTMGLGLWFLALFVGGVRTGSRWRIVLAGIVLGWIVSTRSYDAVIWAAVAGTYVAVTERGRWRSHLRQVAWFLAGLAPFVVALLLHNAILAGSPLTFPITVKDPLDAFGFGDRRIMPGFGPVDYGPGRAVRDTAKHGFFLPWFLTGAYVGIVVAAIGAWAGRVRSQTWLPIGLIVAFPLGYLAFWGTHVSSLTVRLNGPIYYIPLYGALCILMAMGLRVVAGWDRRAAGAVLVGLLVITVPVSLGRLSVNRELSERQLAWTASVEDLERDAVVVVADTPYLLYSNPFSANAPDTDGSIIYTTNTAPSLIGFLERHPDRDHVLQLPSVTEAELLPTQGAVPFDVVLRPLERVDAEALDVEMSILAPTDGAEVWIVLDLDGEVQWRRVAVTAGRETLAATWRLGRPAGAGAPLDREVPEGGYIVTVGAAFVPPGGESPTEPDVRHRFHLRATADELQALVPGVDARRRGPAEAAVSGAWGASVGLDELGVRVSAAGER